MLFRNNSKCIYRGFREITSKKTGKPFTLVTISDPESCETFDFFPGNVDEFKELAPGSEVSVGLDTNGSFTSIVLLDD